MSIQSFRKKVEKGTISDEAPVCYPAAIEQLSRFSYGAEIYHAYQDYVDRTDGWSDAMYRKYIDDFEDLIDTLVRPLGGLAFDDIVFKTVTSAQGLRRAYKALTSGGYNLVVEIACVPNDPESHGVGIIPIERDYVTLVSTHVPKKLQGVIHIDKVAACLYQTGEKPIPGHPVHTANVTGIPNL